MDDFVSGPLVWVGILGFLGGCAYKVAALLRLARREKTVLPTFDLRYGARSVGHWSYPFGSRSSRLHPFFTLSSFAFHVCLLLTPLLVMGHAVLWESAWGVSWWSLPPGPADAMTLVVLAGGALFLLRRLTAPEVRNVTTLADVGLLLLVLAPFATGLVARMQWLPPRGALLLHIVCGVAWLLAIPFTRLVHMMWFFFSRAYMGSEFGAVRNARDW